MRKIILAALGLLAIPCSLAAAAIAVDNNQSPSPRACLANIKGLYGFQCQGSAFNGVVFGPVTFVGTVQGSDNGIYDGHGTLSSSAGSFSTHIAGPATFGPNCFGHVEYTTNEIVLPNGGGVIDLGPAGFDFIGVNDGDEILGTGVAPFGVTGDLVPRLTCRLVRTH